METLFNLLSKIEELLNQIDSITQNQTTILIASRTNLQEEDDAIDLMNQMVDYKDEIMNELETVEKCFQETYAKEKRNLTNQAIIDELQSRVGGVLKKKQLIMEHEQNNLVIMQQSIRARQEPLEIKPNAGVVANAYKKHQAKS